MPQLSRQQSAHYASDEMVNGRFNLDYNDTVKQLDVYYGIGKTIGPCLLSQKLYVTFPVKRTILRYQSPVNGLFPVLSSDAQVGSVRDSLYCASAIWSLYQAYRRIDDDRGKSHELGQSAVKTMRGILECWIRQATRSIGTLNYVHLQFLTAGWNNSNKISPTNSPSIANLRWTPGTQFTTTTTIFIFRYFVYL